MTITATVDRDKTPSQGMSRTILNERGACGRTAIVGRGHSTVFIMNTVGPGSQGYQRDHGRYSHDQSHLAGPTVFVMNTVDEAGRRHGGAANDHRRSRTGGGCER